MELSEVFKALISKKDDWDKVTDDDKDKTFFIINRFMSKKYPEKSQLLNLKTINKISSMNLWHSYMLIQPYPKWFWSKGNKVDKSEMPEKDYKLLIKNLQLKDIDLDYLINKHPDFIQEELKWFKKENK